MGDVTILVNNAAVVHGKSLIDSDDDALLKTQHINTLGQFWVSPAATGPARSLPPGATGPSRWGEFAACLPRDKPVRFPQLMDVLVTWLLAVHAAIGPCAWNATQKVNTKLHIPFTKEMEAGKTRPASLLIMIGCSSRRALHSHWTMPQPHRRKWLPFVGGGREAAPRGTTLPVLAYRAWGGGGRTLHLRVKGDAPRALHTHAVV